jgi:hypothetical protein
MRTKIILTSFLVTLFGLSLYAAASNTTAKTCIAATQQQDMDHMSPMNFENMKVTVDKTETGVSLSFTTDSQNVEALRQRVHWMADMMNNMHGENSGMMNNMHGRNSGMMHNNRADDSDQADSNEKSTMGQQSHQHGMMHHGSMMSTNESHQEITRMMHSATVNVADIDGGVRLTFVPEDKSELDLLAKHLESMVPMMNKGHFMTAMRQLSDEVNPDSDNNGNGMHQHDHSKHE